MLNAVTDGRVTGNEYLAPRFIEPRHPRVIEASAGDRGRALPDPIGAVKAGRVGEDREPDEDVSQAGLAPLVFHAGVRRHWVSRNAIQDFTFSLAPSFSRKPSGFIQSDFLPATN